MDRAADLDRLYDLVDDPEELEAIDYLGPTTAARVVEDANDLLGV